MKSIRVKKGQLQVWAAVSAASLATVSSALGQSNVGAGQVVISSAGSTALKNWIVAKTNTFTEVQPGTTLSIDGVTYPPTSDGGVDYWSADGGDGISYQIAPKNNVTNNSGGPTDDTAAVQFVYHESGSVEGTLELANDQLYTNSNYGTASGIQSTSIAYVTANVDRNPDNGNAVWLNYNQIGASGVTAGAAFNAASGATGIAGTSVTLGNFYAAGVAQAGTPGQSGTAWVQGSASNPTPAFNVNGVNLNGGQNAVQFALSDATPVQIFQNNYGNITNTYTPAGSGSAVTATGAANSSFNSNPLDLGYGNGNTAIPAVGSPGTPGLRAAYQSPSVLNMAANAQNPRAAQGTTFGTGAWNNASDGGIGNLNVQLTAVTATAFVANPGTGLTQVDRTDADWLETTGRLANGAVFNMTTRDVNSGTRDVSALDTGVDPTYAVGKDDEGNGNATNAVSNAVFDQEAIGPAERFSNKTAGGAQLRPTVQNNRMAVGTLSINDAGGNDTQSVANPVRVLSYSDSVDGSAPYVSPNFATISNGTYVIYQNEEVLTLKAPGANYADDTVVTGSDGAQIIQGQVQGDDADGDVVALLNNTAESVATANAASSPANPADGLLSQGYIIPSLMQVEKNYNGQGLVNSAAGQIDSGSIQSAANPNFDAGLYAQYAAANGFGPATLPDLTTQQPTTGTGSTYGGKGGTFAKSFFNGPTTSTAIPITANNYLFGNFNQNGIRDFSAVKSALAADVALITADQAVNASVPGSEFTSTGDNNGVAGGTSGILNTATVSYVDALGVTHGNLDKGDLIVMGDYTGDGHFDGADLVALADGAALSDNTGTDRLLTHTYQTGVLNKNAALDYLNANVGTTGADLYIRQSGRAILEAPAAPSGATAVLNAVSGAAVIDPVSGLPEFSYDPNGVNTFNKSDVNQDGTIDFNDALLVDNNNGKDYTNLGDALAATEQAPVTGQIVPFNLVMATQQDNSTVIGSADLAVMNQSLAATNNANWYGYNIQKTGPGTINWGRTAGTVTVYTGASLEISSGAVQVGGTVDPFSDNSGGATSGNHVAITVDGAAGTLAFVNNGSSSTVSSLTVNSGGVVDLGKNKLVIAYGSAMDPISAIAADIARGAANNGSESLWTGSGITSSAAATSNGKYSVGYLDGNLMSDNTTNNPIAHNQIIVQYTLTGDAFLEGTVGFDDLLSVAQNYGGSGRDWAQGSFDYTGLVGFGDLLSVAQNYGSATGISDGSTPAGTLSLAWQGSTASASIQTSSVPEPGAITLLVAGTAGLLGRRRRRAR